MGVNLICIMLYERNQSPLTQPSSRISLQVRVERRNISLTVMSPQHLILEEYQELKELRHSVGKGGERGGKETEEKMEEEGKKENTDFFLSETDELSQGGQTFFFLEKTPWWSCRW